jgi:Xaa-Pro aminopeptidase
MKRKEYQELVDEMKQGVTWPFIPYEEYRQRINRAKECLAEKKIDAMILFSPFSFWYYGGFTDAAQMHNEIWRTILIISQDHDPVAISDFNFIWAFTHTTWIKDVKYHSGATNPFAVAVRSGEDFYNLLYDTLKTMGLADKTIGFETGPEIATYLGIDEFHKIKDALPNVKAVSADPVIWAQRMIKTPYEQELIREGSRRACLCVREAYETIRPGVTERDIHKAFWRKAVDLDLVESPHQATWLFFSSNPAESLGGHRWITPAVDRIIKAGDFGHCDCGPTYKMYQLDFQRAFYVGKPPEKTLKYYNIGREAFYETVEAMKPGARMCDLFNLSVEALKKRGYPEGHSIVFIGHGEGLANHEPPWITAKETMEIRPGMVLAIEIGAFDPEGVYFGGMLEDIFLITETGNENLTKHFTDDLFIAPAL